MVRAESGPNCRIYKYYWIPHQAILSEVDKTNQTIKVIHYGADHVLAVRTIMEDTISLNLKYSTLNIYRADPEKVNSPDEILRLARKTLGEKKWKAGNRSLDFCLSCVLKANVEEIN